MPRSDPLDSYRRGDLLGTIRAFHGMAARYLEAKANHGPFEGELAGRLDRQLDNLEGNLTIASTAMQTILLQTTDIQGGNPMSLENMQQIDEKTTEISERATQIRERMERIEGAISMGLRLAFGVAGTAMGILGTVAGMLDRIEEHMDEHDAAEATGADGGA